MNKSKTGRSIVMSARVLRLASIFRARQKDLLHAGQAGIMIEPCPTGGVIAIATNNAVMGIMRDPHGETNGRHVVSDRILKHVADRPEPHDWIRFNNRAAHTVVAHDAASAKDAAAAISIEDVPHIPIENYPAWINVIKKNGIGVNNRPSFFDAKLLGMIGSAVPLVASTVVQPRIRGAWGEFRFWNEPNFYCCVMGCKTTDVAEDDNEPLTPPAWLEAMARPKDPG